MIDPKKVIRRTTPVAVLSAAALLLPFASRALASEGAAGWRGTYDIVLMWINFGILSFLLIKFLKEPLRNYFAGRKAELANEIDALEKEKEEKIRSVDAARKELESSGERLAALKERLARRGEREKEAMIKAAQEQSRLMLESAQRKVEYRIQQAKANFRSELIDTAVNAAMEQLPSQVTDADNEKLLRLFLDDPGMATKG